MTIIKQILSHVLAAFIKGQITQCVTLSVFHSCKLERIFRENLSKNYFKYIFCVGRRQCIYLENLITPLAFAYKVSMLYLQRSRTAPYRDSSLPYMVKLTLYTELYSEVAVLSKIAPENLVEAEGSKETFDNRKERMLCILEILSAMKCWSTCSQKSDLIRDERKKDLLMGRKNNKRYLDERKQTLCDE